MALDKEFLASLDAIESAEERNEKILKEYEADLTGLKVKRDELLAESKERKEKLEQLAKEREAEKTGFQKRIAELESQAKASGSDETKAFYEAEKKQMQDLHAAKLAEQEKAIEQRAAAYDGLYADYLSVLKSTELDKAMDSIQNLDRAKANILRSTFWDRNQFDLQNVDNEKKLLNKDFRSIGDVLNAFIATDEGKFFLISNSTGGGATGSTSAKPQTANPFVKGKENLDEQARIFKENRTLYESLKQAAESAIAG